MNKDSISRLIGLTLQSVTRAANMLMLDFGEVREVYCEYRKCLREVNEYALHVQANWRIANYDEQIIKLASSDMYYPIESMEDDPDFNWDVRGNNLFDEKSKAWFESAETIIVEDCELNDIGDLTIRFSNNDELYIFADSSSDSELWRLFEPYSKEKHLVMTGLGLEYH